MIENIIFSNLIYNSEYFSRVMPHLKVDYFKDESHRILLKIIRDYAEQYKAIPTKLAIQIEVSKLRSIDEDTFKTANSIVDGMQNLPEDLKYLVDETERFCKQQAMYNALAESLKIKNNSDKPPAERDKRIPEIGAIQDIMRDALSVCFDTSVGLDFFEDWESRWHKYVEKVFKIPFGINILNKITNGGVERGTLNIILAGVNVGKSLALCHLASDYLLQGKNVLYISMEMSEHVCAKRIDANLLNCPMDDFETLGLDTFSARLEAKRKLVGSGRLIIKQYPTAAAHVGHFNALLTELRTKKEFIPDIVLVDYLGIMASSRIKGGSDNSYHLVKSIAEELRGFAVENNLVVWSAAQTTRGAWGASDINMEDTAESAGLPATADFMIAVMETEETIAMGQQRVKQIKSRYSDKSINASFMIGVNKRYQRWEEIGIDTSPSIKKTEDAPTGFHRAQAPIKTDYSNVNLETGEVDTPPWEDSNIKW